MKFHKPAEHAWLFRSIYYSAVFCQAVGYLFAKRPEIKTINLLRMPDVTF